MRQLVISLALSLACSSAVLAEGCQAEQTACGCGFDPARHAVFRDRSRVRANSINNTGGTSSRPAKWVKPEPVGSTPTPYIGDGRTVVKYTVNTGGGNLVKSGETMEPIVYAAFAGGGSNLQAVVDVIRAGVESWNDAAGLRLTFTSNAGEADIVVGAKSFSGSVVGLGGYSAASYNGTDWFMTEGFVQLDKSHGGSNWTPGTLRAVAAHECGHALGLYHTNLTTQVMYPSVNAAIGPRPDDRWYIQFLNGVAPARLSAPSGPSDAVELTIQKAAPIQRGTTSDPGYDGGKTGSNGPGTGTGVLQHYNVASYKVERKPSGGSYTQIASGVMAPGNANNADPEMSALQNSFTFTDTPPASGTFVYRVRAVHATAGNHSYSDEVTVSFTANRPPQIDGSGVTADPNPVALR